MARKIVAFIAALLLLTGCPGRTLKAPELPAYERVALPSQQMLGIANLGGAQYKGILVSGQPKGFANVQFTNTFGDAYSSIDALLATGKVPFQEYNLRWSDTHSFSRKDFPAIVQEAKRYARLAEKYPDVGCGFSGATEHKLNEKDAGDLAALVLAVIPDRCVYVNNPWVGKGAFLKPSRRIWNEVHGADAQPPKVGGKYIWNADGSSCADLDITAIKKRFAGAVMLVCWHPANNGRLNAADPTPRPKREAWPTERLLQSMAFILVTDKGPTSVPRNWTLKSHADRHETPPEFRAYKPVFIAPVTVPYLELRRDGKLVGKTSGPQPFVDGRKRYYLPDYGFKYGNGLALKGGNKTFGIVSPGFRDGDYR